MPLTCLETKIKHSLFKVANIHLIYVVSFTDSTPFRAAYSSWLSSARAPAPSSGGCRQCRSSCLPKSPTSAQKACRDEHSSLKYDCTSHYLQGSDTASVFSQPALFNPSRPSPRICWRNGRPKEAKFRS